MAGHLLAAAERNLAQLDQKLYFEIFAPPDHMAQTKQLAWLDLVPSPQDVASRWLINFSAGMPRAEPSPHPPNAPLASNL
jgi:hypothetical protein